MLLARRQVAADGGPVGEHVDVLIVGAGRSGIGAAHHLQRPSRVA